MTGSIDLNADLGESYGNWSMGDDRSMLQIVTSANIACGFHAGDTLTIQRTVAMAIECGVTIGAHVSYNDLAGFGRRAIDIEPEALFADVLYQLAALDGICRAHGSEVRYVKAHGALYHRMNADAVQADAVVRAVHHYNPALVLLGAPWEATAGAARELQMKVHGECFADRAYNADGISLVPRTQPGAVLHDSSDVAAQALRLAQSGNFASICLHGDTPGAVEHAQHTRAALQDAGFQLRAFAEPVRVG